MTDFKYFELIAFLYSGIFTRIKGGLAFQMAVINTFDDFWFYPEHENRLSNLINIIHYLHIEYAMYKTFTAKVIEVYKHHLDLIKDDDLSIWLSPNELEHFNESVYHLNVEIDEFLQRTEKGS